MSRKKSTEVIDLSYDALEGIKSRLETGSLLEEDKSILLTIVSGYAWIQGQLESAKLTIHRLKKMFGFSTEKRKKTSEKRKPTDLALDLSTLENLDSQKQSLDQPQGMSTENPTKK